MRVTGASDFYVKSRQKIQPIAVVKPWYNFKG